MITTAGLEAAGGARPAPTPEEVQALWLPQLVGGCRATLEHLIEIWPKGVSRNGLAEAVGLSPGSGTFSTTSADFAGTRSWSSETDSCSPRPIWSDRQRREIHSPRVAEFLGGG